MMKWVMDMSDIDNEMGKGAEIPWDPRFEVFLPACMSARRTFAPSYRLHGRHVAVSISSLLSRLVSRHAAPSPNSPSRG